jgi:hypothetical protein
MWTTKRQTLNPKIQPLCNPTQNQALTCGLPKDKP